MSICPRSGGGEALVKIHEQATKSYISVLLVTANASLDEIVVGLDSGADQYVIKPFRIDELKARIRACLRVKLLHDSLKRANARLEEMANLDDLTGLFNMRHAAKKMTDELSAVRKERMPACCLLIEVDNFSIINEQHDHLLSGRILREVAQLIQRGLRSTDIAARYGGDEVLVLMPRTRMREATDLADRIRRTIESHSFAYDTGSLRITVSIGVSGGDTPEELATLDLQSLTRKAAQKLNQARAAGGNKVL